MAKALANVKLWPTVSKYCSLRIVMPTSNTMKSGGNILDQKEVVPCSYKGKEKFSQYFYIEREVTQQFRLSKSLEIQIQQGILVSLKFFLGSYVILYS